MYFYYSIIIPKNEVALPATPDLIIHLQVTIYEMTF